MTELYLIRHAQAEGNLYRMMQGHWDGGVTELGRAQIACLAERLKDIEIDAAYSSDLFRARLTAKAAQKYAPVPLYCDKRLREIDVGPWQEKFFGDLEYNYPDLIHTYMNEPENWHIDGAESYADVQQRAMSALYDIAESNAGKTISITSHGITIRCIMAAVSGKEFKDVPIFGNTSVTLLRYSGRHFEIVYENDVSHLPPASATHWSWKSTFRGESFDPRTDRDYYIDCYADAWLAAHGNISGYRGGSYYASAVEHYLYSKNAIECIYAGDERVGLIDLDPHRGENEGIGWISLLYLRSDYRGQGCGIQLLGRIYSFYSALGRTKIRLHVAEENIPARAFYRKWGFKQIGADNGGRLLLLEKNMENERL